MKVSDIVKRALLAGLGAQEKVKEFIDDLVKSGELSKNEAASLVKEWISKAEGSTKDFDKKIKDVTTNTLEMLNIPTRDDIERLEKKILNISIRLKKLEDKEGVGTKEGGV